MKIIGFQNGIAAGKARMKKLDPGGFKVDGTGAWDKFFRTIETLVQNNNEEATEPWEPPPPPPPPPPVGQKLAPQSYNKGSSGQNARFNIRINCTQLPDGRFRDSNFIYDDSGLCEGGRSEQFIEALKPADEMDGREPWDPYVGPLGPVPPYPAASYDR